MTRHEFSLSFARFATAMLLIVFATKIALADGTDISIPKIWHTKQYTEKMKVDFPYQDNN